MDELKQKLHEFVRADRDLNDLLSSLESVDTDFEYDEYLDEIFDQISVCGYKYYASRIFREIDPIAYRCEYSNWLDVMVSDDIFMSFDNDSTFYKVIDIEELISELESENEVKE